MFERRVPGGFKWLGVLCAFLIVLGATAAVLWHSGAYKKAGDDISQKFIELTASSGLQVENIYLKGRSRIPRSHLARALDVEVGDPMVTLRPDQIKQRLEALSWVKHAQVRLHYPDSLYLEIVERKPLAVWHRNGALYLIDTEGLLLEQDDLQSYSAYPVVSGEGANKNAAAFLRLLNSEPEVADRMKAAAFVNGRRWDLKLSNGLIIHLPEEDVGLSLSRLVRAHHRNGLLDKKISAVDVRYEDRLVIKTRPGAVQTIRSSGKGDVFPGGI